MKTDMASLPGYQTYEYLIVLYPPEELGNKIMALKKEFSKKYEAPWAAWGKPHIPLVKFSQLKLMEERIAARFKLIAMGTPALKIELNDFGSFPTHSIYVTLKTKVVIQKLLKSLKESQRILKTNDQKPHFIEEPNITIARKLLPWQYEKSWLEYSNKHLNGSFIARDMLLLKRREGQKSYHTVEKFDFLNLPVVTTQGKLFS